MTVRIIETADRVATVKVFTQDKRKVVTHRVIGKGWTDNNDMVHEIRRYFDGLGLAEIKSIIFEDEVINHNVLIMATTNDPA